MLHCLAYLIRHLCLKLFPVDVLTELLWGGGLKLRDKPLFLFRPMFLPVFWVYRIPDSDLRELAG